MPHGQYMRSLRGLGTKRLSLAVARLSRLAAREFSECLTNRHFASIEPASQGDLHRAFHDIPCHGPRRTKVRTARARLGCHRSPPEAFRIGGSLRRLTAER